MNGGHPSINGSLQTSLAMPLEHAEGKVAGHGVGVGVGDGGVTHGV